MNALVQALLVCTIVVVATGYATLKFMPAAWRRSVAQRAAAIAARAGLSAAHARRVEAKLSTGGACGSCNSCKACGTPMKVGEGDSTTTLVAASPSRYIPIRRAPDPSRIVDL